MFIYRLKAFDKHPKSGPKAHWAQIHADNLHAPLPKPRSKIILYVINSFMQLIINVADARN